MLRMPERHEPFTLGNTELPTSKKIQASKSSGHHHTN